MSTSAPIHLWRVTERAQSKASSGRSIRMIDALLLVQAAWLCAAWVLLSDAMVALGTTF